MTDTSLDDLGPVDYLVVEFPAGASNFTGEMAAELLALVDSKTIRVIDIVILTKDENGVVEAMDAKKELYGFDRLLACVDANRECNAQALLEELFADTDGAQNRDQVADSQQS